MKMLTIRRKTIRTLALVFIMLIVAYVPAFAAVDKVIHLPAGSWNGGYAEWHNSSLGGYVSARCDSVYPFYGGPDTYTKIYVRVWDSDDDPISTIRVLNEQNATNTSIGIANWETSQYVYFTFKGYDNVEEGAVVSFFGN